MAPWDPGPPKKPYPRENRKGLRLFGNRKTISRNFSPLYLAIFSGIILIILIINGFLEIDRTQKGFYLLLEREATVLIQHFEKNIQEALLSLQSSQHFFGMEEAVVEDLLEILHRIDQVDSQTPLTSSNLKGLTEQYSVASIGIMDSNGAVLRIWPATSRLEKGAFLREMIQHKHPVAIDLFGKPLLEENLFTIAIQRKMTSGIIAVQLNGEQIKKRIRQMAVQRAISDLGLRDGILFVSVQDGNLSTLAHTDPVHIGKREEDSFLKSALERKTLVSRHSRLSQKEEVFEVVKPFSIKDQPAGLIRIAYASKEIRPLLNQTQKGVVLSIFFFLILGISATALIWVNQNRSLRKMEELEERIRLAERLSSLGHLAAGVAHEIRNPLNAISMGLQRIKREFLPREESKQEEYLSFVDLISKEVRRVNEIIEQFLSLSRPFELNLKAVSLHDLLSNLVVLFQEEASALGITLSLKCPSHLPTIFMDEEKLTQALINIMKNGIQAMERGGILRIEVISSKEDMEVIFVDSGSGIPADQMDKIFNYYYTTKEKGVGLGLPIAHRIIEAHNGQLKIESQVGTGTRVIVKLPIQGRMIRESKCY